MAKNRYSKLTVCVALCLAVIAIPIFAIETPPEGGVMAQIMGLEGFDYVRYSYGSSSSSSTFWQPREGINYRELSVAGNKVYTNSSYVNLTRWDSLNYYATIEYKIPIMLGEYTYNDFDPISGSGQFWFSVSKEFIYDNGLTDGPVSYTSDFYIDKVFFKGQKYVDSVTQSYEYYVSSSLSPSTIREDLDDPSALMFKFINFEWEYTRGNDANDDISSLRDYIDLDYLYIRVKIDMQQYSSAIKDAFTVYGLSILSALSDQQYQDSIIINLDALQKALEVQNALLDDNFKRVLELLEEIKAQDNSAQVMDILKTLVESSPEVDQEEADFISKSEESIKNLESAGDALNSLSRPDINDINVSFNTVIPDDVDFQSVSATPLSVILNNGVILKMLTIVLGLALGSYILFGRKG